MEHEILASAADKGVLLYLNENGELAFKAKKKGALDASLKNEIVANKTAIVQLLTKQKEGTVNGIGEYAIAKASRKQPLPLSFSQQRLWMLDQIDGGSQHYNMPMALKLDGQLDKEALVAAFREIVNRHEVLRTSIYTNDAGTPLQKINPHGTFQIKHVSVADAADEQSTLIEQYIAQEANRAFNLATDIMLRVTLLKVAKYEHVLLLTLHHIASDGWSMGVLVSEFKELYTAYCERRPSRLTKLPIQYADYASWQQQWLKGDVLDAHMRFWTNKLSDLPIVHSIPLDKPRPLKQTFCGDYVQSRVDKSTMDKLHNVSQQENASLFMALYAAFGVLISRYSNEIDVAIGTPVANREQIEVADLVGFFVNMLVLRPDLSDEPNFLELLKRCRNELLGAYNHQQYPFEQLVDKLLPQRSLSHSPLFQVMIVMQSNDKSQVELPQLSLSSLNSGFAVAKYDLTLLVTELEDGLVFDWEYNTDLFERQTIERFASHFGTLIQGLVNEPQQGVFKLPLLTEQEQNTQVKLWNDTSVAYPQGICIEQLFLEQVLKTPDNVAIVDEHGQCTYFELFEEVLALLAELNQFKYLGPEKLVAIRLPKGRYQVISTLAVMMSGSAYLPLECDWPDERCRTILQSANVSLLLVQSLDNACAMQEVKNLDVTRHAGTKKSRHEVLSQIAQYQPRQTDKNLAYVIFTSGSTGKPKGVAVEHASVVNTLFDINKKFSIDNTDKVLAVSALSFDLSVYDFFGILAVGGGIIIPSDKRAKDPAHWLDLVERHKVTVWNTVPVSMALLVEQLELSGRTASSKLKSVLMSGDWIAPDTPKRIWRRFGPCNVYSLGGATEGSIWSIYHPIVEDTSDLTSIPYGKPLGNQAFYILNQYGEHCPVGVTGELHIGGDGVVREYLNNPTQTQSHFIWHSGLRQKIYRTGDLGRYLVDGTIEFCGRTDNQLKIRGFRVELGEVEKNLQAHPLVKKALAIAFDSEKLGKQIAAYVVLNEYDSEREAPVRLLLDHLNAHLPYYMIPRGIAVLAELPLTANGKVDRKSLPDIESERVESSFEAPRVKEEILIAEIWQKLLDITAVGRNDDFFALGGNSLLATRFVAMLNVELGTQITIGEFFRNSLLRKLAAYIDIQSKQKENEAYSDTETVMTLNASKQARKLFFIHPGSGMSFCYRHLAERLEGEAQCFGLNNPLIYGNKKFQDFDAYLDDYYQQINAISSEDEYYILGYSSGGVIAYEVANKLKADGAKVRVGLIDSFATLEDLDAVTAEWYSPIKQSLMQIMEINVEFDWQSLDGFRDNKEAGIRILAHRMIEQKLPLQMGDVSVEQVSHFLMHFYDLYHLKRAVPLKPGHLACHLFKASELSIFNDLFSDCLDWDKINADDITCVDIDAKHQDMLDLPAVDQLANAIIKSWN
ncbi:amino acid adenylation domain-containing protein [Alteromonas portus]|uniref:amino acid adenylation domain-containing protein n=1 Tax=Alteromonas portus TaxID=2565549 RepID=UPI003BF83E2A